MLRFFEISRKGLKGYWLKKVISCLSYRIDIMNEERKSNFFRDIIFEKLINCDWDSHMQRVLYLIHTFRWELTLILCPRLRNWTLIRLRNMRRGPCTRQLKNSNIIRVPYLLPREVVFKKYFSIINTQLGKNSKSMKF